MCQIFACTASKPDLSLMRHASKLNTDGAGVAWMEDGWIHWAKGLDLDEVERIVYTNALAYPFIVHFRSASKGGKNPLLTHPFTLHRNSPLSLTGRTKEGVLFHNGTWHTWDVDLVRVILGEPGKCPGDVWSDSRALALIVARKGEDILRILSWGGGKAAIFKPVKDLTQSSGITLWGEWFKKEGWSYSSYIEDKRESKGPKAWSRGGSPHAITGRDWSGSEYFRDPKTGIFVKCGSISLPSTEEDQVAVTPKDDFSVIELQEMLIIARNALKGKGYVSENYQVESDFPKKVA